MRRGLLPLALLLALTACETAPQQHVAEFWRPISEPNILMPSDKGQQKLGFDLSQCQCGIYPANTTHSNLVEFQPDQQRMAQTAITITPDSEGNCRQQPSLVVSECMRQRGWEPTACSGRLPTAHGGAMCAEYTLPDTEQ